MWHAAQGGRRWGVRSHASSPVDAGTLMIASEKKHILGVFDLVCQDQTYRLQRQLASAGGKNRKMMTTAHPSSNLEQEMTKTNKITAEQTSM